MSVRECEMKKVTFLGFGCISGGKKNDISGGWGLHWQLIKVSFSQLKLTLHNHETDVCMALGP